MNQDPSHANDQPLPLVPLKPTRSRTKSALLIGTFATFTALVFAAPLVASAATTPGEGTRDDLETCWDDLLDNAETSDEEHAAFEAALSDCGVPWFGRTLRITFD